MPVATPLREIEPGLWSNGHLRFVPAGPYKWTLHLEGSGPNSDPIARVGWNGVFGEFVLKTKDGEIFGWDCLNDISDFIQYQNDNRVWP